MSTLKSRAKPKNPSAKPKSSRKTSSAKSSRKTSSAKSSRKTSSAKSSRKTASGKPKSSRNVLPIIHENSAIINKNLARKQSEVRKERLKQHSIKLHKLVSQAKSRVYG